MKKLLPLLILVGCANDQDMSEAYSSCMKSLYKAEDEKCSLSIDNTRLTYEIFKLKQLEQGKPVLVALPEPRPVLNLKNCIFKIGKTWCEDVKGLKNWSNFGCIANVKTNVVYCPVEKCLTITSDESECDL